MVSFTSISHGAFLVVVMMLASSSAASSSGKKAGSSSSHPKDETPAAPHINATSAAPFKLPPLISSRTRPASHIEFAGNLNAETESAQRNKQWFNEHGGNFNNVTKRDSNTVGGMTLDLPDNAPPASFFRRKSNKKVINASSAQIKEFTFHAALSATAYCRGVVPLGRWSCEKCLKYIPDGKLITTFTTLISDSNGYVLRSDAQKTIHLVFRGTNSIRNAVTDLVFDLTNYPPVKGAKVHTGFLASYNEVVKAFFPIVQAQITDYPNYKVVVSGHSFGGAQALLAGLDLYQRDKRLTPKNLSIFTVGSPRVGNPDFAYYVESTGIPYSRSVNNRDIVPHLPPQAFGFLHPGIEAWARTATKVQICDSTIETKDCSNSIVPFTSILDHLTYYDINVGLCL